MNNEPWTQISLIEYSAGFYLYSELPADWDGMDDEQLFMELEHRAWEPLEAKDGDYIWEQINTTARSLNETFNLGVNL